MNIDKRDNTGFEPEARLEELAEEIHAHHQAIERAWVETVAQAIELGDKLIEAKSLVLHGQWSLWLRENFPGSERTAQNYMRLARAKPQTADLPTVRDALALLARSKAKPADSQKHPVLVELDKAVEEHLKAIEDGWDLWEEALERFPRLRPLEIERLLGARLDEKYPEEAWEARREVIARRLIGSQER